MTPRVKKATFEIEPTEMHDTDGLKYRVTSIEVEWHSMASVGLDAQQVWLIGELMDCSLYRAGLEGGKHFQGLRLGQQYRVTPGFPWVDQIPQMIIGMSRRVQGMAEMFVRSQADESSEPATDANGKCYLFK